MAQENSPILNSVQTVPAVPDIMGLAQTFQLAAQSKLRIDQLLAAGEKLTEAGLKSLAVGLYRLWLTHNTAPLAYIAQYNMGVLLVELESYPGAEVAYKAALVQKPDLVEAHLNLGRIFEITDRPKEAIKQWKHALSLLDERVPEQRAFYLHALNALGRILELQKQLPDAEAMLAKSLKLDPNQRAVLTHWTGLRQKQCKWPIDGASFGLSQERVNAGMGTLTSLCVFEDPKQQLEVAKAYAEVTILKGLPHLSQKRSYGHERLRVGYLSSDFCRHAIGHLTAELYELHDRSKVEVFAFCWTHEDPSPLRARIVAGMDHHVPIGALSDEDAARLIRSLEIDILVDLQGITKGVRPNILTYRPAPVQITWLGYPGPTAFPEIDYVLADPFVLPPELEPFFTEKPLRMPHVFQVNDRKRPISPKRPTRASLSLPEEAFVYCSMNNNFKITPEMFACWLRILNRVPGSILLLVADNQWSKENLIRTAKEAGIATNRLRFVDRIEESAYLARYTVADLFLDTYPFNGGTTASDALWAGLPLLTLTGRTFGSRMAGSLLRAVDLPELVTETFAAYEEKAVALAHDRSRIQAMKQQLDQNRLTCRLFDSPQFVRELEALYRKVVDELPRL